MSKYVQIPCPICGEPFWVTQAIHGRKKYCSFSCQMIGFRQAQDRAAALRHALGANWREGNDAAKG